MEFRPILSAMLRNKTGVILVGLQIALTLAVVANAVFIIAQRAEKIGRDPGFDSANTFFVQSYGYGPKYDQRDTIRRDLDMIRALPGIVAAASISGIPLSGGGSASNYGITGEKDTQKINANYYETDEQGLAALGVKLAEGRAFTEAEVQYNPKSTSDFVPSVIVTRDLARALYGDQPALGKNIYDGLGQSAVIVGVIDHMLGAWVDWDKLSQVIFYPRLHEGPTSRYVVRAEPGRRDALIAEVERKLSEADITRAITWVRPHSFYMDKSYRADSRMIIFLSVMAALIFIVTALGIVGLASFHVNVRTKQIGTRRAVGARRIDIIRYFMLENWLLTTGGVVVGTLMAFALGHWLSTAYALPRLQPIYVGVGVITLWILGQLAVFIPARRAAAIPPAMATRTV
ncbi:MAG TPA: FtsX-like permease family protein [Steroidobacteraceae bacterium]|jgi:putative ABC transport system permease protein